jgi:hypothetical protein
VALDITFCHSKLSSCFYLISVSASTMEQYAKLANSANSIGKAVQILRDKNEKSQLFFFVALRA